MNGPLVSFSMHPRWAVGDGLDAFLDPLQKAGLGALEFGLDVNDPLWPQFRPVMDASRERGLELCFHAPYLPPHTLVNYSAGGEQAIQQDYGPALDLAAAYGPATVVFHGAQSADRPHELLYRDTVAFLRWVLEAYPTLTVAFENLIFDPLKIKIGAGRVEVLQLVTEIGHPRLGICWDMGHDVMNQVDTLPDKEWLAHVVHVHFHDLDEDGCDHYPMMFGRVPYERWLPALTEQGFTGIATMEIKGGQLASLGFDRVRRVLIESVANAHRLVARRDGG